MSHRTLDPVAVDAEEAQRTGLAGVPPVGLAGVIVGFPEGSIGTGVVSRK